MSWFPATKRAGEPLGLAFKEVKSMRSLQLAKATAGEETHPLPRLMKTISTSLPMMKTRDVATPKT